MTKRALKYPQKQVLLKKASSHPDFTAATILVSDPWQYVDLWLRRQKQPDARFYWEQAKQFYDAAKMLPPTASPLPAYYCLLNATKALLEAKGQPYARHHGVTGWKATAQRGLRAERVQFKGAGVLPSLIDYLGESKAPKVVTLHDLLYNLPFVHRAFTVTYTSVPELFIPVCNPRFVVNDVDNKVWFEATVESSVASGHTTQKLPPGYERDHGVEHEYVVRRKKRFRWTFTAAAKQANVAALCQYHHGVRKSVFYIHGASRLWYLKRKADGVQDYVDHTGLVLTFAAMHRLSELARYEPLTLAKHFEAQHNWLLTEFIEIATSQFIDEIAAELTGRDFMVPSIRK